MAEYITAMLLSVFLTYISVHYEKLLKSAEERKQHRYVRNYIDSGQKVTLLIFQLLSALPLVLIAGFRYNVGRDWGTYATSFMSVIAGKRGYYSEKGYILVQRIVALFTDDYMWLFLVCAVIFAIFYFSGIYKMSLAPPLSVMLLVCSSLYFSFLNGMRQGLALAILFFSLQYVFKRDLKRFLLMIVLALGFHTSSIAFIIVYPLFMVEINIKKVALYTIVFGAIGISGGRIVSFLLKFTKYAHYYESIFANEGFELIWFLISITILIVMCFYHETSRKSNTGSQFNVLFWMQMLAVIFCLVSASIPGANRIVWMFNTGQLLSLPLLISYEKDKRWRLILLVLIVGFYALATCIAIFRGSHKVLPYQTYFQV